MVDRLAGFSRLLFWPVLCSLIGRFLLLGPSRRRIAKEIGNVLLVLLTVDRYDKPGRIVADLPHIAIDRIAFQLTLKRLQHGLQLLGPFIPAGVQPHLDILSARIQDHGHPIMQKLQLLVRIRRDDCVRVQLLRFLGAFILDTVPEARETHQLPILAFHEMRHFVFWPGTLFQPFEESLRNDEAPFLRLHRRPHAAVLGQAIVAAIDRFEHA